MIIGRLRRAELRKSLILDVVRLLSLLMQLMDSTGLEGEMFIFG